MNPPGTICFNDVYEKILRDINVNNFLDVGCGGGENSQIALQKGMKGVGIDFSPLAIQRSQALLDDYIKDGKYKLIQGDFFDTTDIGHNFDLVISFFTMEHIEDDEKFLRLLKKRVRPGGYLLFAVPAQSDKWGIEDDTVGHLRRYEKTDLINLFKKCDISIFDIFSIGVPLCNAILKLSNLTIIKSMEKNKLNCSKIEQTKGSGVREIPYKTVFPKMFKLFLNRKAMYPFLLCQRLFFHSEMGINYLIKCKI